MDFPKIKSAKIFTAAEGGHPVEMHQHHNMFSTERGQISYSIEMVPHENGADGEFYESGVGTPADARRALLEAVRQIDGWLETLDQAAQNRVTQMALQRTQEAQEPTPEQVAEKAELSEYARGLREHHERARQQVVSPEAVDQVKREAAPEMVVASNQPVADWARVTVDGKEIALPSDTRLTGRAIMTVAETVEYPRRYELVQIDMKPYWSGEQRGVTTTRTWRMAKVEQGMRFMTVLRVGEMD